MIHRGESALWGKYVRRSCRREEKFVSPQCKFYFPTFSYVMLLLCFLAVTFRHAMSGVSCSLCRMMAVRYAAAVFPRSHVPSRYVWCIVQPVLQCRMMAVRYAAAVFPRSHVPSRYALLLACGDQ